MTNQNIVGLEKAYQAVYNRQLRYRVKELVRNYGPDAEALDRVCTELNPDNTVPCFWKVSELARAYGYIPG